jgi:hypothetical protein
VAWRRSDGRTVGSVGRRSDGQAIYRASHAALVDLGLASALQHK